MKTQLSYLASPYSHKNPIIKLWRFIKISRIAAKLHLTGRFVLITPISASVPQNFFGQMGCAWATWEKVDCEYIRNCKEVLVCTMQGWRESVGVNAEILFAKELKIPIKYLHPDTLKITRWPSDI